MTGRRPTAIRAAGLARSAAPGLVSLLVLAVVAGSVVPVATVWLTKVVFDGIGARVPADRLLWPAAGLLLAGVAASALPAATRFLHGELDRAVRLVAKDRLYRAVNRLTGIARFEEPPFVDRLRLADRGATTPASLVESGLALGKAAVTLGGLLISLFVVSAGMAVVLMASAAPALAAELALARGRARLHWKVGPVERREIFYTVLLSTVEAAKEIRLFDLGGFLRRRMLTEARTANQAHRKMDRREALTHGGLGLLSALVAGGGLVWGIVAATRGELSVGDIAMFVAAVAGVQGALAELVGRMAMAHQELLLFEHYFAVVDARADLPSPPSPRALPPLRRGIELRNVWFRYTDEHDWVLRGVDLRIPHGQAVGLVGHNGAGKSTIVKLLCRFYDPNRGAILWDGVDLRDVPVEQLRQRVSGVFQDYMHYELTAAENIAVGDLAALGDRDRIRWAARRIGMHDVLTALPHGYDTLLSRIFFDGDEANGTNRGVQLSGGQWQRLALARALLRDRRDLMILDEPSSGLDAEAEHEIHSRLREHRRDRTSLLISHRLAAIREADLIAVLADGAVTEIGDHSGLMAANGVYANLFAMQAAGYREVNVTRPVS
ncbi:ABC transporter ATP-binding protein [Pseudonocardia acaciae]|uniref:ABC transporter ATP-binding protein n=1 Tax=Pseudonocardia acaciae TaxID=551276 RepID=UPI00048BBBD0|nr:ABC transporter ATP-binding protein [Pseudonocardia acaciae]